MLKLLSALFLFTSTAFASIHQEIKAIEQQSGGRIGISALDMQTNKLIEYRSDERFPFCSTFKVMGVSAVLKKSMEQPSLLNQNIKYTKKDMVAWSSITEKHMHDGMTVEQLCEATITTSDNTAMNLLMDLLGGPKAITAYARSIGDTQFNLVRRETDLGTSIPGDIRDTTTPKAMRISLQKLVLGSELAKTQRHLLQHWLKNNKHGEKRIRASLPNTWFVEDKTGSGDYGTTNDIGVIYPPHCKPIVLAIYFTQKDKNATPNEAIIASVTKTLINEFGKTNTCLQN